MPPGERRWTCHRAAAGGHESSAVGARCRVAPGCCRHWGLRFLLGRPFTGIYGDSFFIKQSLFQLICGDGSLSRRSPFWTQCAGTASVAAEGRRGSARKESDRDYFTSLIKSNYTSQILWPREVYHASISCLFYQPELQTVTM